MRIGIVGLGRMGGNIARRLIRGGHECVVYDRSQEAVKELSREGAISTLSLTHMARELGKPAVFWIMLPAGEPTEQTINAIAELAGPGDIVIDGGNSFYKDDIRRE